MNEFGKPNMVKPSVRFDEGREGGGHWRQRLSTQPLPPTLPKWIYRTQFGQRQPSRCQVEVPLPGRGSANQIPNLTRLKYHAHPNTRHRPDLAKVRLKPKMNPSHLAPLSLWAGSPDPAFWLNPALGKTRSNQMPIRINRQPAGQRDFAPPCFPTSPVGCLRDPC